MNKEPSAYTFGIAAAQAAVAQELEFSWQNHSGVVSALLNCAGRRGVPPRHLVVSRSCATACKTIIRVYMWAGARRETEEEQ